MQAVTKTLRELIRAYWPTSDNSDYTLEPTIPPDIIPETLDVRIKSWWHGDREVINLNDLPAIAIDAEAVSIDWSAFQTQIREYKLDVMCYVRRDDYDDSTTAIYEMARQAERAIRRFPRWWAFELSYFTLQPIVTPSDILNEYGQSLGIEAALDEYEAIIIEDFETAWAASHTGTGGEDPPEPPELRTNDLLVSAYSKFFYECSDESILEKTIKYPDPTIGPRTMIIGDIISKFRADGIVPARYIGDCRITDISYGYVSKGNALVRACQISLFAKEMEPVVNFGPL
jgi:hypothetical protein